MAELIARSEAIFDLLRPMLRRAELLTLDRASLAVLYIPMRLDMLGSVHALDVGIAVTAAMRTIEGRETLAVLDAHRGSAAVAFERLALDGKAATTMAATSAATREDGRAATAVASTAALLLRSGLGTFALAAAMATPWLCYCRGCDRQGRDTRSEKQPGHRISPSEREKRSVRLTVPTSKRLDRAF